MQRITSHLSLGILAKVTIRYIFQMAFVSGNMVHYVHIPMLIYPQFADDDVVHSGGHFPPCVVVF